MPTVELNSARIKYGSLIMMWDVVRLTDAGAVVSCQLEARFTLAGEGAGDINAAMLAISVPALINVCGRKTSVY